MTVLLGLEWQRRALCALETGAAPELWTSDKCPEPVVRRHLEQMCARCPVRRQCAAEAVDSYAQCGMYAGVWVPDYRRINKWLDAMEALREVAGLSGDCSPVVGVSA
jgi:WhiB family redox-sensing transcriptional regulator